MKVALLIFSILTLTSSSPASLHVLHDRSSLSVNNPADVLVSPDGVFVAGFYPVGSNAYCFAVWFNEPSCHADNCTTVWMANRDLPVNGKNSKLSLLKSGNLFLSDAGHSIVWSTNTASRSSSLLKLHDSGNLVLENYNGVVLWQSFDFPTDTLLPLQPLTKTTPLVSSRSRTNFSSGFFKLYFDSDNVLRLLFDSPEVSSIYWPNPELLSWEAGRSTYNNSRIAQLNALGNFTSTDDFTFLSADYGNEIQRRLKIDYDGNVRLYSRQGATGKWEVSWQVMSQPCRIHGSCGPNSICNYLPGRGRNCSCIPGHKMMDHTDWSLGCVPEFDVSCHKDEVGFLKLTHVEFYGYDFSYRPNFSFAQCADLCASRCDCKGFQFKFIKVHNPDGAYCFAKTLLLNGQRSTSFQGNLYLKVPKANLSSLQDVPIHYSQLKCQAEKVVSLDRGYVKSHKNYPLQFAFWFAIVVAILECLVIFIVWCFLMIRSRCDPVARKGYLLATTGFRKFSYGELRKATKGFREEIGRGAGGIVYKGVLPDKRVAAIKQLIDANQGEAELLAEISTIGRLNHMNLIEMWGYCIEGRKKLLVFEYMEHGSLAKKLSSGALDWKKRVAIAIGTAKGLAYLHEECLEWILHCDVKPENILLDSEHQPKVSDFGLSWLLNREDSTVSRFSKMRGTRGYMAPEWIVNLPITSKVDVYSYGIVLLELVTGRNAARMGLGAVEEGNEEQATTLVQWVRQRMGEETGTEDKFNVIIDPTLMGKYEIDEMGTLVSVALQCVEEDKDARPTMGQVVKMLLGDI